MPRLSIITTVWNADSRLLDSICSIRSRPQVEHIISVAEDFQGAVALLSSKGWDDRMLIATPGAGISEGFNACIARATGEFIWVLNSGDREICIDPLLDRISSEPSLDFVYGNIRKGGKDIAAKPSPIGKRSCLMHGMGFCHGAAMVRRSFHEKFGLYDPSYRICMDNQLFVSAILRGARMAHVNEVVAEIEPGGLSSRILPRVRELHRVVAEHAPWPAPILLAAKWFLFSHLARLKSRSLG